MSLFGKLGFAVRLVRRRAISVGGVPYSLRGYAVNPLWLTTEAQREPWLDVIFRAVFRCKEGAFLDVGANVGQTLLKVLSIERSRQYVGVEPQVTCASAIDRFIRDNNLSAHSILPIGLSKENKVATLYTRDTEFFQTSSVVKGFRPESFYKHCQQVCLRKGDEVVFELGLRAIALVKIDVEGGELEVIEGLAQTLRAHRPFVVFEVLNFYLAVTKQALEQSIITFRRERIARMEGLLREMGYAIYRISAGGVAPIEKIEPGMTADMSQTNYVAVPNEKVERFAREVGDRHLL